MVRDFVSSCPSPTSVAITADRRRPGKTLLWIVLALVACSTIGYLMIRSRGDSGKAARDASQFLVHTAERADFVSLVTESGDLESASNVEVRCEVKSPGGTAGTTILEIADEGEMVVKGDLLVQFDDSALQINLIQQEILVATDQAAVIEAQSELNKAKQTLNEYKEGLYFVDQETFESELFQAESNLKSAQDSLTHGRRLFRKGYVSRVQFEAQQLAVEMAIKARQAAKTKLRVLGEFTRQKTISESEAEIEKQKAKLIAAEFTVKLSQKRRDELTEQVSKCRILAPIDGQVVYANDYNRIPRIVIEEGVQIRQGQVIIRLPDPKQMQVGMRISDSKINLLQVGNEADIVLDVNPDLKIRGELVKIEPFPFPREWPGAPIEYGATVRVVDPPVGLRPGQRSKVHVYVQRQKHVLQVPIQAVIGRSENHYCLIQEDEGKWDVRQVSVGPSNDSFVVVESGLNEGERVAINPDLLWDDVAGDDVAGDEVAGDEVAGDEVAGEIDTAGNAENRASTTKLAGAGS